MISPRLSVRLVLSHVLVGALALLPCVMACSATEATQAKATESPVRKLAGLTYASRPSGDLMLDLYLPAERPFRPGPLIVWIHGGGWAEGGRGFCPLAPLVREGYVVASISYRLAGVARFPAQIEDCKAAVRWLRAHAVEHGFDPQRLGACGESAGGLLAALLGTAPVVEEWGDIDGAVPSAVQAVAALCPPTDLTQDDPEQASVPALLESKEPKQVGLGKLLQSRAVVLEGALGGPLVEHRELARAMSPLMHVSGDDPPFLLIHGDRDRLVPLSQSVNLQEALCRVGVPVELVVVPGAGHGFGRPKPELMARIKAFFDAHL